MPPDEWSDWEDAEKDRVAKETALDAVVELSHFVRAYNLAFDQARWPDEGLREREQFQAVAQLLNYLFRFDLKSRRFAEAVESTSALSQPVQDVGAWVADRCSEFDLNGIENRLREELDLDDAFSLVELFPDDDGTGFVACDWFDAPEDVAAGCSRGVGFVTNPGKPATFNAFPGVYAHHFLPIDDSVLLAKLAELIGVLDASNDASVEPDHSQPPALILDSLQTQILRVLDGKAMRVQALADACAVEKNKLYQKRGDGTQPLRELSDAGRVILSRKIGYYRPDAPPPEVT